LQSDWTKFSQHTDQQHCMMQFVTFTHCFFRYIIVVVVVMVIASVQTVIRHALSAELKALTVARWVAPAGKGKYTVFQKTSLFLIFE